MRTGVDFSLVPSFVEVVRQGSFTAAAKALDLPKSTVSRHVTRLEASLGVALLVRTTRRSRLTADGERFYARVAPALERIEEAARAVTEQQDEPRGHLRISVPADHEQLPLSVASFVARYPEITVEVNVTGERVDLVKDGFDLAIRAGRLRDSSLVARRLATPEFQLFAHERYLAERGTPRAIEDLADHEVILFRPQNGVCRLSMIGPDGPREVDVRGHIWTDDLMFVRGAVAAGAGIGLVPGASFGSDHPFVQRLLADHCVPSGAVYIVYPGAAHIPAKVRAFRDHLLETLPWNET